MRNVQLKINDKVYDRFLLLLSKFNSDEVEIVNEDQDFVSAQSFLRKELDEIQSGNAKFVSQSEFENRLD